MLSVIVATNESERVLVRTLASLVPGATSGLISDVVLADAGSKDETAEIGDVAGCRLVTVPGPLGPRLEAAVSQARGDWLLFLPAGAELEPGWVGEATHFIERASSEVAGVFTAGTAPRGQGSLFGELLAVFRSRGSVLKPGRGLLISKRLYRELGGHGDRDQDAEGSLLRRVGRSRINTLRTGISRRSDT